MRKSVGAALTAITVACLAAPLSASLAQAGISTNPAPVETRDYLGAMHALSRYEVDASRLVLTRSQSQASRLRLLKNATSREWGHLVRNMIAYK